MLLLAIIPALAALIALGYGVAWMLAPASRAAIEARYPLRTITWLIASVAAVATLLLTAFGAAFAADAFAPRGRFEPVDPGEAVGAVALPVVGLIGAVAAVTVIVLAHRDARPGRSGPFAMLYVAAVPIAVVVFGAVAGAMAGEWGQASLALVIAAGSTANALFGARVRRARSPVSRDGLSMPVLEQRAAP